MDGTGRAGDGACRSGGPGPDEAYESVRGTARRPGPLARRVGAHGHLLPRHPGSRGARTLYTFLHLPRSTLDRKIRNHESLPPECTERVLGLERLVGQVTEMVAQSGDPAGFDADRWVAAWLDRPLPALGGAKPADFMDTMEGQKLITQLLAQSQSGTYA